MKAKWCSYRYRGTITGNRWCSWRQRKTIAEMSDDLYSKRFGITVVQVVVNPKLTGRVEDNELWIWKPGKGWKQAPADTRNWYKDTCDPNCPPSLITDDDIFTGNWLKLAEQEHKQYAEYLRECEEHQPS